MMSRRTVNRAVFKMCVNSRVFCLRKQGVVIMTVKNTGEDWADNFKLEDAYNFD